MIITWYDSQFSSTRIMIFSHVHAECHWWWKEEGNEVIELVRPDGGDLLTCLAIIRAKFRHEDLNIRHFRCLLLVRLFIRYRRPSYEGEPSRLYSDSYVIIWFPSITLHVRGLIYVSNAVCTWIEENIEKVTWKVKSFAEKRYVILAVCDKLAIKNVDLSGDFETSFCW